MVMADWGQWGHRDHTDVPWGFGHMCTLATNTTFFADRSRTGCGRVNTGEPQTHSHIVQQVHGPEIITCGLTLKKACTRTFCVA